MTNIIIDSELPMDEVRGCHALAKNEPHNDLFKEFPHIFAFCLDGIEGFKYILLNNIQEEMCEYSKFTLYDSIFIIDGEKTALHGSTALRNFIEDNYQSIYKTAGHIDCTFSLSDNVAAFTEDPETLTIESQEFVQYLEGLLGKCEPTHDEL